MIPSDVLNIPRCTHGIPPMYSWYPSDVLNIPQCTHGIPHIHHDISQCTEHTLYRLIPRVEINLSLLKLMYLGQFVLDFSNLVSKSKLACFYSGQKKNWQLKKCFLFCDQSIVSSFFPVLLQH